MSYIDQMTINNVTYPVKDSKAARSTELSEAIASLEGAIGAKQDTLTEAQLAAANSGINATKTAQIATNTNAIAGKQNALSEAQTTAVNSGITSTIVAQVSTNASEINTIEAKIPEQASSSNQLADKNFVNSSIQTQSAHFRGNWATWSDVPTDSSLYPIDDDNNREPTSNDYMVVQDASGYTSETLAGTWRFKYSGTWATEGKNGWHPEYQVNETPLTAAQLAALNSGITSEKVAKLNDIEEGAEVNVQADWSETDTAADDYIKNKPTIPTVVQATGSSTTNVMSQKAVTDAIAGVTETYTIASGDWTALADSDPYDYSATVTATATISASTIAELYNDNAVLFGTYGFAIGDITAQSVTIYSVGQPSSDVTLKVNYRG